MFWSTHKIIISTGHELHHPHYAHFYCYFSHRLGIERVNIPNENDNHSVDYTYNAKQENFDAANYNVPNVPVYSQAFFPKYEEDRYGNLDLFTTSIFRPHQSICATYLWTEANTCSIMEGEAYDMEGNNMWFKQCKFPINLQAESQGELMDGAHIKVTNLIDTGCSKPILNKKFYDKHTSILT